MDKSSNNYSRNHFKEHGIRKELLLLWVGKFEEAVLFAQGNGSWYCVESQPHTQTSSQASTTSTHLATMKFTAKWRKANGNVEMPLIFPI